MRNPVDTHLRSDIMNSHDELNLLEVFQQMGGIPTQGGGATR
jgi:hypothetical protein